MNGGFEQLCAAGRSDGHHLAFPSASKLSLPFGGGHKSAFVPAYPYYRSSLFPSLESAASAAEPPVLFPRPSAESLLPFSPPAPPLFSPFYLSPAGLGASFAGLSHAAMADFAQHKHLFRSEHSTFMARDGVEAKHEATCKDAIKMYDEDSSSQE
jgi:hypothetical protein